MARVLYVATETRLTRSSDGVIRSRFADTSYAAWSPYLEAFDRVVIVARVEDSASAAPLDVEGPSIEVLALPDYKGSKQMLIRLRAVRGVLRRMVSDPAAVYAGRAPGVISTLLFARARRLGAQTVAIVVGDPVEVARIGAAGPVLRILAPLGGLVLRWQVRHVTRASYVTERVLQERYPVRPGARVIAASNVRVPDSGFAQGPRAVNGPRRSGVWRLVTVGSQEATYKGHGYLLQAVAMLINDDVPIHLTVVGGGQYHEAYRRQAASLGIGLHVHFAGHVADTLDVRRYLDDADLFVFPSLTEGLPRALVEAMARGLPCIATNVGGIPELLPDECMVAPRDAVGLARTLREELSAHARMAEHSAQNLVTARRVVDNVRRADPVAFLAGVFPETPERT